MTQKARAMVHYIACLAAFAAALFASPVLAHKPSDSYVALTFAGGDVEGQWDISLRDLDHAIGLDRDDDGAITWNELRAREADIAAYALSQLILSKGEKACALRPAGLLVDRHSDGAYAALRLAGSCKNGVDAVTVSYNLFFDLDPQHRGLLRIVTDGVTQTAIFGPDKRAQQFGNATPSRAHGLVSFMREGVWHIWIGFDHLLFLCALLLPAMLVRKGLRWEPTPDISHALWNVAKIVTAFTIAHSITLSLAALEWVSLPSRWVESAIAASVLAAALNNIYPVVQRRLWIVAFVFGLIHGFGFASVLLDLGLPRDHLLLSLLGFNLGVELGQLAIVGIYFAVAYAFRSTPLYTRGALSGGSAAIALIAMAWMIERGLDLKLMSF
jgi:hypothetical protein